MGRWEVSEVRSWGRWEGSELPRWESSELPRWERWENGEVERWEVPGFIQGWGIQDESKILSFCFC